MPPKKAKNGGTDAKSMPKVEKKIMIGEKSRPDKPDFAPLYKEHRKIMEKHGLDFDKIVKLRKHIHKNAEGGF